MNNNISLTIPPKINTINLLGNNSKNSFLGNLNFNTSNLTNSVQSSVSTSINTFQSYSPLVRYAFIGLIIIIIISIAYLLYRRYHPSGGPVFIPDLRNNATKSIIISRKDAPELISDQYTYSFWLFINGTPNDSDYWGNYRTNEWKHILHRGNKLIDNQTTLQAPGFWLAPNSNKVYAAISTSKEVEFVPICDIDMDKWVNIAFVRRGQVIEIYKNCLLEKTLSLYHNPTPASQSDIHVTENGGFAGNISYVQYFNQALRPEDIRVICQADNAMFKRDLLERINNSWAGYTPPVPIPPTPEPPGPEPNPTPDPNNGGQCKGNL
jgi:hypothetical protein